MTIKREDTKRTPTQAPNATSSSGGTTISSKKKRPSLEKTEADWVAVEEGPELTPENEAILEQVYKRHNQRKNTSKG